MPYQSTEVGQGQDPAQEPRVEVIRRLIAYPPRVFDAVLTAVQAAEDPKHPLRWLCYRDPGDAPTRPYWLCFVSARPGGRRFHLGLELFDRDRLGLWFFSGYTPETIPRPLLAPFPTNTRVSLPRVELSDLSLSEWPLGRWIKQALSDKLSFAGGPVLTPARGLDALPPTNVGDIGDTILSIPPQGSDMLGLRFARARLAVDLTDSGGGVELHPLGRLSTLIGRDPRCNIVIDHPNVSSEHLRITFRGGEPGIEELGSKNGTSVGGVPVKPGEPVVLPAEVRVSIGGLPCLFVADERPLAQAPEVPPAKPRHHEKVEWLVAQERLSEQEAEQVYVEARGRGITAGEVLLDRGKLTLAEWNTERSGGNGGCGLAVLLIGLLFLVGCHSFGLPPIIENELDPVPSREGSRRVEWDYDVGVKPLVQARATKTPSRVETHFLFPLGLYEKDNERSILRLYPFFQHIQRTDPDGFEDTDTILFPFLLTGNHPVDGRYLYVFPFGGTLKGLLGKDEAVGVLFPLYGWTRDRETETHHFLWPLISYTTGPRSSGFRFFPFYGHQEKRNEAGELVFNRTSILWPLLNWADDNTNSRNRFESFFLFPFFGYTRSSWVDDNTILWPLFRWWHDKRTDYEEYRLPFPFFIYGSGPDHTRLDMWPFFGFRQRGDYKRHFFLWPIERYEYMETEEYRDARLWIAPFFRTHHRIYSEDQSEDVETRFWPLLRYTSKRDGFLEISALDLLWFDDPLRNFDSILAPFWTLFRYTRDSEGYEHLNLLFGLYSSRTTPQGEHRWDILGGLIGHTSNPGGDPKAEGKTRLLWLLEF